MGIIKLQTLDPAQARSTLFSWEQEDKYYSGMNTSIAGALNKRARPYPYLQTNEAKANETTVEFPFMLDGPITVVYLDGKSDSGLPHTRGKKGIALPVFLLWHPSEKTIRHELVHLSQKQYTSRWYKWYEVHWNFRRATNQEMLSIPERWRERRRINPDTLGTPYMVWQNRYIPLSVFSSTDKPDLRYCKRGFWDLKMTQWTWEEPPDWVRTFGSGFNDEHPNEIAAHWIDGSAGNEKRKFFDLNPI
jgi:hypothetical protein